MADTTEMIRLMRHAADLLKQADPTPDYADLHDRVGVNHARAAKRFAEVVSAMACAEVLLRTIAAAMEDEPIVERAAEPDLVAMARQEGRG